MPAQSPCQTVSSSASAGWTTVESAAQSCSHTPTAAAESPCQTVCHAAANGAKNSCRYAQKSAHAPRRLSSTLCQTAVRPLRSLPAVPLRRAAVPVVALAAFSAFAAASAAFFCFSGAVVLSSAGADRRLISSNFARLRADFTLCAAAARSDTRSSSTTLRACCPASPTLPSAAEILSSAVRRDAEGCFSVDSSSKVISCISHPPSNSSSRLFSACSSALSTPRSSTTARWVR